MSQDYTINLCSNHNSKQIGVLHLRLQMINHDNKLNIIPPSSSSQPIQQEQQPAVQITENGDNNQKIVYEIPIQLPLQQHPHRHHNHEQNNIDSNMQESSNNRAEWLLTIVDAQTIKKGDYLSKSDPYILIKSGHQTFKTKMVKNSEVPIWNEQFRLNGTNDVELLLMDADVVKDDQIGRTDLQQERLMRVGMDEEDINLPILMKNQETGKIHLRVRKLDGRRSQQDEHFLPSQDVNSVQKGYQPPQQSTLISQV